MDFEKEDRRQRANIRNGSVKSGKKCQEGLSSWDRNAVDSQERGSGSRGGFT